MTTYKWIKVMYLKMRRIILLLNYLGLLMNIHTSIDRGYFFTKRLDVLRKKKIISNKDEIEILIYLTRPLLYKKT